MKKWIFSILIFFMSISLAVNFGRQLLLRTPESQPETLDIFSIVETFQILDLPATDLFNDLASTLKALSDQCDSIVQVGKSLVNPSSTEFSILKSFYRLGRSFFDFFVGVTYSALDGFNFLVLFVQRLYTLLNTLLGSNFSIVGNGFSGGGFGGRR